MSSKVNSDYDRRFKTDTIALRELLSRLPGSVRSEYPGTSYEHPTNPISMGMVGDDWNGWGNYYPSLLLIRTKR